MNERTRIKLGVYVDLDPVPGTFHSAESAQASVRGILARSIEHYNPMVSIESWDTSKFHGPVPNQVIFIYEQDPNSYQGNAHVVAVAESEKAAMQWIQDEVDEKHEGSRGYAPGHDALWWMTVYPMFKLAPKSLQKEV